MRRNDQIGVYKSPQIDITEIEAEEGYAASLSQQDKNSADWTTKEYNEFSW